MPEAPSLCLICLGLQLIQSDYETGLGFLFECFNILKGFMENKPKILVIKLIYRISRHFRILTSITKAFLLFTFEKIHFRIKKHSY